MDFDSVVDKLQPNEIYGCKYLINKLKTEKT